jgi:hypothetical protein
VGIVVGGEAVTSFLWNRMRGGGPNRSADKRVGHNYRSVQFDQILAVLQMFKYLREEGLEPLCECGIGAISDTYPHNGCFSFGSQQEDILKVFVFRNDHVLLADRVGPYSKVRCEKQLSVLNMNGRMAERVDKASECRRELRVD